MGSPMDSIVNIVNILTNAQPSAKANYGVDLSPYITKIKDDSSLEQVEKVAKEAIQQLANVQVIFFQNKFHSLLATFSKKASLTDLEDEVVQRAASALELISTPEQYTLEEYWKSTKTQVVFLVEATNQVSNLVSKQIAFTNILNAMKEKKTTGALSSERAEQMHNEVKNALNLGKNKAPLPQKNIESIEKRFLKQLGAIN